MRLASETPVPAEVLPPLTTLPGVRFDPKAFEADLQKLAACQRFVDVRPTILLNPPEGQGIEIKTLLQFLLPLFH